MSVKGNDWGFHPLEVVDRYREPQLQVSENDSILTTFADQTFSNLTVQTQIQAPELLYDA